MSQAADLYAVAAQAAAQVDRARQSAKASMQAALSQKPKFKLHVTLDAPKVAVPIPATPGTEDGVAHESTFPVLRVIVYVMRPAIPFDTIITCSNMCGAERLLRA